MANKVEFDESKKNLSKYPHKYNKQMKVNVVSRMRFVETKFKKIGKTETSVNTNNTNRLAPKHILEWISGY